MNEIFHPSLVGKKPFILPGEFDTTGSLVRAGLSALGSDPLLAVDPSASFVVHFIPVTTHARASLIEQLWETYSALMAIQVESVHSQADQILAGIEELMQEEDVDDYTFRPTPHAHQHARTLIQRVYGSLEASIRNQLPEPRVFSDGTGGIVVQWNYSVRGINAGFPPTDSQPDYIYYEAGDKYKLIDSSVDALKEWLEWLIHE